MNTVETASENTKQEEAVDAKGPTSSTGTDLTTLPSNESTEEQAPFPELHQTSFEILVNLLSTKFASFDTVHEQTKEIMQYLSQSNSNYTGLLDVLGSSALKLTDEIAVSLHEVRHLTEEVQQVTATGHSSRAKEHTDTSDGSTDLSLSHLRSRLISSPNSAELFLRRIVTIMCSLRKDQEHVISHRATDIVKSTSFQQMSTALTCCLENLREVDFDKAVLTYSEQGGAADRAAASSSTNEGPADLVATEDFQKKKLEGSLGTLSVAEQRFTPLIDCYMRLLTEASRPVLSSHLSTAPLPSSDLPDNDANQRILHCPLVQLPTLACGFDDALQAALSQSPLLEGTDIGQCDVTVAATPTASSAAEMDGAAENVQLAQLAQLVRFTEANKSFLNAMARQNVRLLEGPLQAFIAHSPLRRSLDFGTKRNYFRLILRRRQRKLEDESEIQLSIRRDHILEDTMELTEQLSDEEWLKGFEISFEGEEVSSDAGCIHTHSFTHTHTHIYIYRYRYRYLLTFPPISSHLISSHLIPPLPLHICSSNPKL